MGTIQPIIHYLLHFIFPLGIAYVFFHARWKQVYLIFILTMLVDADHFLAHPVFNACRCSIGFHPLHSYPAMIVYAVGLLRFRTRVIAIGLLMHMGTDYIDCLFTNYNCE